MPKLEDIELFKNKINSLGREEQILAERGEHIADMAPPEQGVPDDISALLDDISDIADSPEDSAPDIEIPAENADSGFSENLDDDLFDNSFPEVSNEPVQPESDNFDDDLGSISELGEMFEDAEPEDESAFMPDDLVDAAVPSEDDLETASADSFDINENIDDFPSDDELPPDFDSVDPDLPGQSDDSEPGRGADFEQPEVSESFELPGDLDAFEEFDGEPETIGDDSILPDSEEDFNLDDLDVPDQFGDLESGEDLEQIEEGGAFDIPEGPDTEEDLLSDGEAVFSEAEDLESFELPEDLDAFEEFDGEPSPEITEEDGGLPVSDEDFDLGDLDVPDQFEDLEPGESLDSGQPEEAGSYEGELSEPMEDLESFDLPEDLDAFDEFEDETAPGEDETHDAEADFEIGSLDDISLEDELEINPDDEISLEGDEPGELEDLGALEDLDDFAADSGEPEEFSLEDLGEEYSTLDDIGEDEPETALVSEEAAVPEYEVSEKAAEETVFSIEKEKLDRITETLNQMPRNLKFILEDLIGNKGLSGKRLDNLVEKLAAGASVKEITALAEKITGRKIKIPSQYQRKTWEELEEEKQTFPYILKHQILPYAGKIALISVALFFTVFVIKKQVYDPVYSNYLYDKGYEQLENENYKASDRLFNKASRLRPFKKQFYRYAEGYIEKREYGRAENKYITMLGRALSSERQKNRKEQETGYFPVDKKGFLDYAALKTFYQGEYAEGDRILNDFIILKGNKWDYEALINKIDNFLNWGELDRNQFDSAAYVLNDCLSKFGNKPELVFRKIAYYLHSGRIDQVEAKALSDIEKGDSKSIDVRKFYTLVGEFRNYVENIKEKHTDPYVAADFYKYLIDHDKSENVEERLIKISNQDKNLVEPHYQLSRYWNKMEKKELEIKALKTIEQLLKSRDMSYIRDNYPHSYNYAAGQRNRIDIFTDNRLGRFSYDDDEILDAQRYFKKSVDKYEKYSPLPGETASYGHIYEDLGDIYYYNAGKYNEALKYFGKAYNTGYKNDNLDYKIGFINYKNRSYREAAEIFYDITLRERENSSALFAFANSSFNYGIYSPAKAYYDRVIEKMEYWKDHEKVFDLDRRKDQQEILEGLMQVYNNQGVTLFKLAEKNSNPEYYSKSLVYLSQSSELYDTLMRDPLTMNKTLTKPLAQLNMKWILLNSGWKTNPYAASVIPYSSDNMSLDSPVIYNSIDYDLFGKVNTNLK